MFGFRFGRRLALAEKSYDFPIFRPPSEADSLLLRMTHGCPWNRCAFCPMYRDVKFKIRPIEEVKRDIDTACELFGGKAETVFIGDSDSLVMDTKRFCSLLEYLYNAFPGVTRVTSYARAGTLKRKSPENLKMLREAGLTRLHIGLETGHRVLLKKFNKGACPETMITGCSKAKEIGFEVSLYILAGIGGQALWREHASETAMVLNQIDPHFIRVRTLTPQPGTAVYQWWMENTFQMPDPATIVKEQGLLIEGLSVASTYLSDHVSNYVQINGRLPDDKEAMLRTVRNTLQRLSRDDVYRNELEKIAYLRRL